MKDMYAFAGRCLSAGKEGEEQAGVTARAPPSCLLPCVMQDRDSPPARLRAHGVVRRSMRVIYVTCHILHTGKAMHDMCGGSSGMQKEVRGAKRKERRKENIGDPVQRVGGSARVEL